MARRVGRGGSLADSDVVVACGGVGKGVARRDRAGSAGGVWPRISRALHPGYGVPGFRGGWARWVVRWRCGVAGSFGEAGWLVVWPRISRALHPGYGATGCRAFGAVGRGRWCGGGAGLRGFRRGERAGVAPDFAFAPSGLRGSGCGAAAGASVDLVDSGCKRFILCGRRLPLRAIRTAWRVVSAR